MDWVFRFTAINTNRGWRDPNPRAAKPTRVHKTDIL